MIEVIFLIVLALIWIVFATVQDLRVREVANWLNFSLIIFALGFRFFYSLFVESSSFNFFYQGLIGLGIFFIIGNLFYYGRIFAGGDAKLMIALGPILGFSHNLTINLKIYLTFVVIFLFVGGFYGIFNSVVLSLKNSKKFKKEFTNFLKKHRNLVGLVMFLGLVIMVLGFYDNLIFYLGVLVFILPYLYLFAKSVDESCMVEKIKTSKLTVGDWLYKDVKVKGKVIRKSWGGLTKTQIRNIKKKHKEVWIKQGIAFVPVFLISFLILLLFYFLNWLEILWNSFW